MFPFKIRLNEPDDDGCPECGCPVRGQHSEYPNRHIYRTQLRDLAVHYAEFGLKFGKPSKNGNRSKEFNKLCYWGLLEPKGSKREPGGSSGVYRVTDKGLAFMRGQVTVPKFAIVSTKGSFKGLHGDEVGVKDVDPKFDASQLRRNS